MEDYAYYLAQKIREMFMLILERVLWEPDIQCALSYPPGKWGQREGHSGGWIQLSGPLMFMHMLDSTAHFCAFVNKKQSVWQKNNKIFYATCIQFIYKKTLFSNCTYKT